MNDLRQKLKISGAQLDEINALLLDPNTQVINDFLQVVAKHGTPEEINHKAAEARKLPNLMARLKAIDTAHEAAVWARVRELFDYPVFFAEPENVGITSTGADGPNDLPGIVKQYRQFAAWVEQGAQPEMMPNFQ